MKVRLFVIGVIMGFIISTSRNVYSLDGTTAIIDDCCCRTIRCIKLSSVNPLGFALVRSSCRLMYLIITQLGRVDCNCKLDRNQSLRSMNLRVPIMVVCT